jgi:tRNA (guanine37-N1)-methyltransferase
LFNKKTEKAKLFRALPFLYSERWFFLNEAPAMNLKQTLSVRFPHLDPTRLPGGFDRVGDIAVIGITPELETRAQEIGKIILGLHKNIRVVAKRDGQYGGQYRTLPLRVIAGEERLTTVHRENGINIHLDLGQVYFSVRSAHERARIAALVRPGETVAVLCSGVGPFPLIIGRHSEAQKVIGIEKNPVAHGYALRNLRANRKIKNVHFFGGDAVQGLVNLGRTFDRILVVLPHGGETLLPGALEALRPGGTLHFYDMQTKGRHAATLARVAAVCQEKNRRMRPLQTVVCGHCGPTIHRICLDAVIDTTA